MLAAALLILSTIQAKPNDVALVIAAQEYADSRVRLQGPRNDAESIGRVLTKLGFSVSFVGNDGSGPTTQEAIEQALARQAEASKSTPFRRFVFYFAGHGSLLPTLEGTGSEYVLLPEDFDVRSGKVVRATALRTALDRIQSGTKTLILDACFSGAIFKSDGITSRFVPLVEERGPVSRDSLIQALDRHSSANLFVLSATSDIQPAIELQFGNKSRGLFTYALEGALTDQSVKSDSLPSTGSLLSSVSSKMTKILAAEGKTGVVQTPNIYPTGSGSQVLFGTGGGLEVTPHNLLELDHQHKPGKIRIDAPKQRMAVGEVIPIRVKKEGVQKGEKVNGYACIIGKRGDRLYRLAPSYNGLPFGLIAYINEELFLTFTEPGLEELRLFEFNNASDCMAFNSRFPLPDIGNVPFQVTGLYQGTEATGIDLVKTSSALASTESITFEVIESLVGENEELSKPKLRKAMTLLFDAPKSQDALLRHLGSQIGQLICSEASCPYYTRMLESLQKDHKEADSQFLILVNRVLSKFDLSSFLPESLATLLPTQLQTDYRTLRMMGEETEISTRKPKEKVIKFNTSLFKLVFCDS